MVGAARVVWVVVLTAVAAGACSRSSGGDDDWLARLSVLVPTVEVAGAGDEFADASDGQDLEIGDQLRTDSDGRAQIDYADGSLTRLGADTEFALVELAEREGPRVTVTDLDVGTTYHRVTELTESGERFEVQTASLTAAVVGTRFVVTCFPDGTCIVTVIDGEVVVTTISGEEITLRDGERVVVDPDGSVGEVERLSPDELADDPWIAENLARDAEDADGDDGDASGPTTRDLELARVVGEWQVDLVAREVDGFRDVAEGDVRQRVYELRTECDDRRCRLGLAWEGAEGELTSPTSFDGSSYRVEAAGFAEQDCELPDGTVAVDAAYESSVVMELRVADARRVDGAWLATELRGTATETATPTAAAVAAGCAVGEVVYDVHAEVG